MSEAKPEPEPEAESETEELDRASLLRTTSEREYLELLADDDKMALIAEKLLEIHEGE